MYEEGYKRGVSLPCLLLHKARWSHASMAVVNQQNRVSCCIPCCCLGHKAVLKPLGPNIIACQSLLGQRHPVNTVSIPIIQLWPVINLQYSVLLKIPIVENLFSTEYKPGLQNGSIGTHTLDHCDKFQIQVLQLHAVVLLSRIKEFRVVELPATP